MIWVCVCVRAFFDFSLRPKAKQCNWKRKTAPRPINFILRISLSLFVDCMLLIQFIYFYITEWKRVWCRYELTLVLPLKWHTNPIGRNEFEKFRSIVVVACSCACQTIISGYQRESAWFLLLPSSQFVMHPSHNVLLILPIVVAVAVASLRQLNSIHDDVMRKVKQMVYI